MSVKSLRAKFNDKVVNLGCGFDCEDQDHYILGRMDTNGGLMFRTVELAESAIRVGIVSEKVSMNHLGIRISHTDNCVYVSGYGRGGTFVYRGESIPPFRINNEYRISSGENKIWLADCSEVLLTVETEDD